TPTTPDPRRRQRPQEAPGAPAALRGRCAVPSRIATRACGRNRPRSAPRRQGGGARIVPGRHRGRQKMTACRRPGFAGDGRPRWSGHGRAGTPPGEVPKAEEAPEPAPGAVVTAFAEPDAAARGDAPGGEDVALRAGPRGPGCGSRPARYGGVPDVQRHG